VIGERKESTAFPDEYTSSYAKDLSDKHADFISIEIFFEGVRNPPGRIAVVVQNKLRGMEQPVKAQIDELGDRFDAELSSSVGKDKVTVEGRQTSLPLFN